MFSKLGSAVLLCVFVVASNAQLTSTTIFTTEASSASESVTLPPHSGPSLPLSILSPIPVSQSGETTSTPLSSAPLSSATGSPASPSGTSSGSGVLSSGTPTTAGASGSANTTATAPSQSPSNAVTINGVNMLLGAALGGFAVVSIL